MMYKFKCTQCGNTEEKEISIKEYDAQKDEQTCSSCSAPMKRVIEWTGIAKGEGQGWCGNSKGNVI